MVYNFFYIYIIIIFWKQQIYKHIVALWSVKLKASIALAFNVQQNPTVRTPFWNKAKRPKVPYDIPSVPMK